MVQPHPEGHNPEDQLHSEYEPGTNEVRLIGAGDGWVILGEPLYRTWDGGLVPQQDPDARQLYGTKGQRVPVEELRNGGLDASDEPGSRKVAKNSVARKARKAAKHAKKDEEK